MKQTETLILTGEGYGLSIAPEAETLKATLIKHSALIVAVNDPAAADAARTQIGKLADMRILVEKSRKTVKEPVLAVGRDIDAKAAEFVEAIKSEESRVSQLIGEYAAKVEAERQRVMREIEAKRQEEARVAMEAEAARIKAEREAEAARIAAENAMFAASTPAEDALAETAAMKARQAAEQAAEAARQRAAAACDAEMARQAQPAAMVPEKVAGAKFVTDYEITDIHALYRHDARLVALTERRSLILSTIDSLTVGDALPEIPGLRVFKKAVVSGR